ncbi:MAG: ribonuclease P protein component [Planctomycetaceae bacterium]|nr:ribonuclease P protein component [Planctomycetaceae bacterium]
MTLLRGRQKFPKAARVRSRLDFAAVYERGLRIGDACMSLIALSNDESRTRLGLAVSKRCGNSVRRNRLKRRLREAFRLSQAELPTGLDLVIQPRADTPIQLAALRQSLISLTKRAAKKWASQTRTPRAEAATPDAPPGAS